jgi:hypothetical protein
VAAAALSGLEERPVIAPKHAIFRWVFYFFGFAINNNGYTLVPTLF